MEKPRFGRHLALKVGLLALSLAAFFGSGGAAQAHPHIFIEARSELVFDQAGRIAAVRNIWQFDKAYTAFLVQGLDKNRDGKLSAEELQPMAKTNVEALASYEFFTYLTIDGKPAGFLPPSDYGLTSVDGGGLILTFVLPLKAPSPGRGTSNLVVFDRDYFVAITYGKENQLKLIGAPAACKSLFQPPQYPGDTIMSMLSVIPPEEHDLPPDLAALVTAMANSFQVSCP